MDRIFRTGAVLAIAIASAIGFAGFTSTAQAQANCETYGKLAQKLAKQNEERKCGLTGPRWSTDLEGHKKWCGTVGPTEWRTELKKRTVELKKCKA